MNRNDSIPTDSPAAPSSARLAFEAITAAHAPLLYDDFLDKRIYEFLPFDAHASIDVLQATYTRWSTMRSPDGLETWLNWALRLHESGVYVGTVQATLDSDRSATLAYIIFPRFWRSGFGREGVRELVRFLFTECDVAYVRANLDSRNTASLRLVESLHFSCEGLTKNADHFKGSASDEYHFILRDRALSE
ncbi:MAG TPA: GNAT family N-acetyltransferase [Planctomycetaceae bacterium]|nr:GNAT family N-acetyltransferase [Planctomycetaceae bacterium]